MRHQDPSCKRNWFCRFSQRCRTCFPCEAYCGCGIDRGV